MDTEDRIRAALNLFAECEELDSVSRDARLAEADPEVAADVRRMLDSQLPDEFLVPPDAIPPDLADYEVLERIGVGGMGVVLRARHRSSGDECAIKLLRGLDAMDTLRAAAFRREASRAFTLRHPNIVPIRHVGETGGVPYVVMDYIAGPTLRELLSKQAGANTTSSDSTPPDTTPPDTTLPDTTLDLSSPVAVSELLATIADALHYSHESGILHLDVKPSNILIQGEDPRLVDFGIARDLMTDTGTTSRAGTPHYMSPEQALIRGTTIDRRTDIYSLGVVAYELLAKRRPFDGQTETDVLEAVLRAEAPAVHRCNPDVPPALGAIIEKAIQPLPGLRYRTAEDFADDLRRFVSGDTPKARPPTPFQIAGAWCQQRKRAVSTCLLVLLVASISISVMLLLSPPTDPRLVVPESDGVRYRIYSHPMGGNQTAELIQDWERSNTVLDLDPTSAYRVVFEDAAGRTAERFVRPEEVRDYELKPDGFVSDSEIEPEMVYVRGGAFVFGVDTEATVGPLLVDRVEVTNGAYMNFMDARGLDAPQHWPAPEERGDRFSKLPVTGVSAEEAELYAAFVGKRLPTAIEWEWVVRGPENRVFVWGDELDRQPDGVLIAPVPGSRERVFLSESERTILERDLYLSRLLVVGSSPGDVSWCNVLDLQGSVREWTATAWFNGETGAVTHTTRLAKGGSFFSPVGPLSWAGAVPQPARDFATGFRCVKSTNPR